MVLAICQYDLCKGGSKCSANCEDLTVSVVLEVEKLIIPLGYDPYCIFHECTDYEEPSSCRYVSKASKSLSQRDASSSTPGTCTLQYVAPVLAGISKTTHCFMGSAAVSSHSSILFVCSLSCSSGLGSFVASALPGPPNLLSCEPRL